MIGSLSVKFYIDTSIDGLLVCSHIVRDCTGRLLGTPREQINKITSYIDGSMVYGLSKEIVTKLRTLKDGKMKLQNGGIIPVSEIGECCCVPPSCSLRSLSTV